MAAKKTGPKQLNPRQLIVAWQFRPTLQFYGNLDRIGLELEKELVEWRRADRQLALTDKVKHRQVELTNGLVRFRREFELTARCEVGEEIARAAELYSSTRTSFEFTQLRRLEVLSIYGIEVDHGFDAIVTRLGSRLHASNESMNEWLGGKIEDLAYTSEISDCDGWRTTFTIGPMTRDEWFKKVEYDKYVFADDATSIHSYSSFCDTIPTALIYFATRSWVTEIELDAVEARLNELAQRISTSVRSFVKYYYKG